MKWQAIYRDGTVINEDDVTSSEDIDRSQLNAFRIMSFGKVIFTCFFPDDGRKKLIFRRRTFMDGVGSIKGRVYLVGWHENVKGVSIKSICYVYENGYIEFDDARNDLELVPCERFD